MKLLPVFQQRWVSMCLTTDFHQLCGVPLCPSTPRLYAGWKCPWNFCEVLVINLPYSKDTDLVNYINNEYSCPLLNWTSDHVNQVLT